MLRRLIQLLRNLHRGHVSDKEAACKPIWIASTSAKRSFDMAQIHKSTSNACKQLQSRATLLNITQLID
jgi:hypothetical protein